jgi:nucleoside-diphosphate-sugar epimerase
MVAALETERARGVWIAADDAPVTYGELLDRIAADAGAAPPPRGGPPGLASFRVRNGRIKRELGWRPAYPSYRSGLAA